MSFKRLLASACGLLLCLSATKPALAQLSQADRQDVARVEAYLNSIDTLRSAFLQASQDGGLYRGMLYMDRPGRMRLEYDPPSGNYVVSDGKFVYFWDDELKQQTNAPLNTSLAHVILRENLRLDGDVTVTDVSRAPGTLELTLVQTSDPAQGQITLVFESNPLRLRKWRVVDAQNLTTEVALLDPEIDVPLSNQLFVFRDPNFGKARSN